MQLQKILVPVGVVAVAAGAYLQFSWVGVTLALGLVVMWILLHVVAMTRALDALPSPKDTQPELYRWTNACESHVTCTFVRGKLQQRDLFRPAQEDCSAAPAIS